MNKESFVPNKLPLKNDLIDQRYFFDELIDATVKLEVYKEKLHDSKLGSEWFLPTLQKKEALESSKIEGTQATLDGVLINQALSSNEDENINVVINYHKASELGIKLLGRSDFSNEFFNEIHKTLMEGKVRKPELIGNYRKTQNYIGRNDSTHEITFVPPSPEEVPKLMDNLISYINAPTDSYRALVRIAIIHAQFETIHPFLDGNGRVGRMLIPLYLYYTKQIDYPCFFISEALERDKIRYYNLLNNTRDKEDWDEWIKFFLQTVARQCDKYINIVSEINNLYDRHLLIANSNSKYAGIVKVINLLYKKPIITAKQIVEETELPLTSVNRMINMMIEEKILITDGKKRNRKLINYGLLDIIR